MCSPCRLGARPEMVRAPLLLCIGAPPRLLACFLFRTIAHCIWIHVVTMGISTRSGVFDCMCMDTGRDPDRTNRPQSTRSRVAPATARDQRGKYLCKTSAPLLPTRVAQCPQQARNPSKASCLLRPFREHHRRMSAVSPFPTDNASPHQYACARAPASRVGNGPVGVIESLRQTRDSRTFPPVHAVGWELTISS